MESVYKLQYLDNGVWYDILLSEIKRYITNDVTLVEAAKQNYSDIWPSAVTRIVKYIPALNTSLKVGDAVRWTSLFNSKHTFCKGIIKDIYPASGIDDYTAYKVSGKSIVTGIHIEDMLHEADYSLEKIEVLTSDENGNRSHHV